MVRGLKVFADHFADYPAGDAVFGGAAGDVLFGEAGLDFRATKDLDIVLCIEVVDAGFAERFQTFLDKGGYQTRQRSDGRREFYRFQKPTDEAYPAMLELFARKPEIPLLPDDVTLTPVPIEDDAMSLSAILVDDAYYDLLLMRRVVKDGLSVIDAATLIPFKARAYIDLSQRKADGERVDSKTIRKHRSDVYRLTQLLPGTGSIELPSSIKGDMDAFVRDAEEAAYDPSSTVKGLTLAEGSGVLRRYFRLD